MHKLPALSDLMAYENTAVIRQFCREYSHTDDEAARQLFRDLMGWMWLSVYRLQHDIKTHMIAPLIELDKMWHIFILHTRDYTKFCENYFGTYFHHEVEDSDDAYEISGDALSEFLSQCYDYLGEEWIMRYFSHLLQHEDPQ